MKKVFGVIGLGRFGSNVARTLAENGAEVIAIDNDKNRLEKLEGLITKLYQGDVTNEQTLKESGILNADVVIVSIGENIEASILVVVQLMNLGVKNIIAKAWNELHGTILEKLGVQRVVYPEKEMAKRLAHSLLIGEFIEEIPFSEDYRIYEIKSFNGLYGKSLKELDMRRRFGISVLAVKRKGEEKPIINPAGDFKIGEGDILLILGREEDIVKFSNSLKR